MLFEIYSLFITSYDGKWNKSIKSVKVPSSWYVMNKRACSHTRVRASDCIDPTRINHFFKRMVSYINLLKLVVEKKKKEEIDLPVIFMVYAMYCDKDCCFVTEFDNHPLNINRRLSKLLDVPYELLEKIYYISSHWDEIDFPIKNKDDIDKAYSIDDE